MPRPFLPLALSGAAIVLLAACGGPDTPAAGTASPSGATPATAAATSGDHAPSAAVRFDEAAWRPPREADIPSDSMGASIRRGLYLLRHTRDSLPRYATSGLNCTSCHLEDGLKREAAPLTGSHARFPKYMPRSGAVIALADRVNYCFTRSLAGNAIPVGSREMTDILAYLAFISTDVPVGMKIAGAGGILDAPDTLVGDTLRGREVFTTICATCHGKDGQGIPPATPLWGPRSFSIGASMARHERAASFIWHNMPMSSPKSLTWQQAFDVASYINSHPRPDSPGKGDDWPMGGAPADVPYDTKGHAAFRPPATLVPRANPRGAVVPNPPVLGRGR